MEDANATPGKDRHLVRPFMFQRNSSICFVRRQDLEPLLKNGLHRHERQR